ncbi:MAG: hypothetical protein WBO44_09110 [Saprospiraceae bacterium]
MIGNMLKFEPKNYYYQFDSSFDTLSNFDRGYVDTFSISKNKFRIRAASGDCCIVEKLKSNKWSKNFSCYITQYGYDISKDVNGDGYLDFILNWKRMSDVYIFDITTNQFIDTSFQIVPDWAEIDKSHKLFCNDWELYKISDIRSELYTFAKGQLKVLYYLNFIGDKDEERIKKIILYKATKQGAKKIREFKVDINEYDFDYKQFWTLRYKQLMGYR